MGSLALTLCLSGQALADCPAVVRVPEDAPSINAAAAMICAGTTAEIQVAAGTWPASIATAVGTEVTVRGAGVGVTTIVPTSVGGRLVMNSQVPNTNRVHFSHATLSGGGGDGWRTTFDHCRIEESAGHFFPEGRAISDTEFAGCSPTTWSTIYQQPQALVERCAFVNCARPILIWGGSGLPGSIVRDCTFTNCAGSCVWIKNENASTAHDRAVIERCAFTNTDGRAIYYECSQVAGAQTPVLNVIDSQFTGNHVTGNGAAIMIGSETAGYASANSNTTVTGCTFSGNSAANGGAIYMKNNQPLTLVGCDFSQNTAPSGGGGAISQEFEGWYQSLTASNCTFSANTASQGGAINVMGWHGTTTLTACVFENNRATGVGGRGGAFWADRQILQFDTCTFDGNSISEGPGNGGAVGGFIARGLIRNSTFRDNRAPGGRGGAAWFYYYCTTGFEDCVFEDNDAVMGGAVTVQGTENAQDFLRCSFSGNQSTDVGAALAFISGPVSKASTVTACQFSYVAGDAPPVAAIRADTSLEVGGNTFCGCGSNPMYGNIIELAPNCVTATCADSDGDGMPDGCDSVTVPGDYATIQGAIDATVIGDFRIVTLGAGTFAGPISFAGKAVVVRGAGAGKTIIDGTASAAGSVVRFTGGEPVTAALEGVTVRGGQGGTPLPPNPAALVGGGVFGFNSAASIRNCVIEQNGSGFGGGVYMFGCMGAIDGCVIRDNSAQADGGGLQIYGGAMSVIDSSITGNYANSRGGGVHAVLGVHEFTRVSITANASNNLVGGLSWVPDGNPAAYLTLDECTVTSNTAEKLYGGIGAVNDNGGPKLHLLGTQVCSNVPAPNISGPHTADSTSEVCDCVADVIPDGVVNGVDLAALLTAWGTDGGTTPRADCNRDGLVTGADLGILLTAWGACAP